MNISALSTRRLASLIACSAVLVTFATGVARPQQVADVKHHLVQEVQRARDVQEIQNLMSRRAYLHAVGRNEDELALWSKKREIRWAQNQGCWVGMKSIKVYYDDLNKVMQAAELKHRHELDPSIDDDFAKNRYIGNTIIHTLVSPIVVVADDLRSAKAVWYTTGVALSTDEDGKTPLGKWFGERYSVDLVKEDRWRFLNIEVSTDFTAPMGSKLPLQGPDAAAMGSEGSARASDAIKLPGPDIARPTYREFGPKRVPAVTPRLPEPYKTLSHTFQYADCSSPKEDQ